MADESVKVYNDIGSILVVRSCSNEGPDACGNVTDDSYDYFVEIGRMFKGKFDAESHHYFINENEFKQWIIDLYNTFIKKGS